MRKVFAALGLAPFQYLPARSTLQTREETVSALAFPLRRLIFRSESPESELLYGAKDG